MSLNKATKFTSQKKKDWTGLVDVVKAHLVTNLQLEGRKLHLLCLKSFNPQFKLLLVC